MALYYISSEEMQQAYSNYLIGFPSAGAYDLPEFHTQMGFAKTSLADALTLLQDLWDLPIIADSVTNSIINGPTLVTDLSQVFFDDLPVQSPPWPSSWPIYAIEVRTDFADMSPSTTDIRHIFTYETDLPPAEWASDFVEPYSLSEGLYPDDVGFIPLTSAYDQYSVYSGNPMLFGIPFPTDGEFQLAWNDTTGRWYPPTSPEDPDTPLKYYPDVSIVRVDFADATRHAIVRPSKDGGFIIYEVDENDVPIGLIRVFRHNRTLASIITPDLLNMYVPRSR